ncbi:MAG TPA: CmcI family methyltransferase [Vineibacter sp.]|nr:CmcI family methyltransferase [Vineibacter sp.]
MMRRNWTTKNQGTFRPHYADPALEPDQQRLVDQFHDFYYSRIDNFRGHHTIVVSWMGYEMFKCPLDLWIYQELISLGRPQVIVETGTYKGGSALYLATLFDLIGDGEVITIDIDESHNSARPRHPRITYITGSSTDAQVLKMVKQQIGKRQNVMVILDSDHRKDHVLEELRSYAQLIPVGGYVIVEDTNINGHPTYPDFGPGPWEAVTAFLEERQDFFPDRRCERFMLTMNPRGFLRRRN